MDCPISQHLKETYYANQFPDRTQFCIYTYIQLKIYIVNSVVLFLVRHTLGREDGNLLSYNKRTTLQGSVTSKS